MRFCVFRKCAQEPHCCSQLSYLLLRSRSKSIIDEARAPLDLLAVAPRTAVVPHTHSTGWCATSQSGYTRSAVDAGCEADLPRSAHAPSGLWNVPRFGIAIASLAWYSKMNTAVFLLLLASSITNVLSDTPVPTDLDAIPGIPSFNVSGLSPEGCFLPDPTKEQLPIIFADCATGIIRNQMASYPDMDKFLIWSREETSTTDIKVPYVRYSGSCALVLNVHRQDVYERDTFRDVLHSAYILARDCVIVPPHRGGQVNLGSRRRLQLTIVRRPGYPGNDTGNDMGGLQANGSEYLAIAGDNSDETRINVT